MWTVRYLPEAEAERNALPANERVAIQHAVEKLQALGPRLPFPHSADARGSARCRELRPRAATGTTGIDMVKLSELATAAEVHGRDTTDPEYQREYDRAALANEVALKVVSYRAEHGLSQAALARQLGMRQPNIARLEAGDHEPSLSTLARLSLGLGIDFSVEIRRGRLQLRHRQTRFGHYAAGSRG